MATAAICCTLCRELTSHCTAATCMNQQGLSSSAQAAAPHQTALAALATPCSHVWLPVKTQTSGIAASVSDAWLQSACRYNAELFGSKLPEDLHISWSTKLKTTAGLTHFKRSTSSDGTVT